MDLNTAIQTHGEWKLKLRGAIQKKEQLDPATIAADHKCTLGQWLHGPAKSQYGALKSYQDCVTRHAAFHSEASKVAVAINKAEYAAATAMLDAGTPYTAASSAVGAAIMALKREVQP
jgi:hypothetical protein